MTPITRVGTRCGILGESPLWDERAGCLWWVDVTESAIRRLDSGTGHVPIWLRPEMVGCIALVQDGELLMAMSWQIALFDPEVGQLSPFVEPSPMPTDHCSNDVRCHRRPVLRRQHERLGDRHPRPGKDRGNDAAFRLPGRLDGRVPVPQTPGLGELPGLEALGRKRTWGPHA